MRTFLALALLLLAADTAAAQSLWTRPYRANQVSVEAVMPQYKDADVSATTGAMFVSVTHSLNENVELVGELPMARYRATTGGTTRTESALGNPYLGVGLSSTTVPLLLEVGVRLPVAPSNEAAGAGGFADVGRTDAFTQDESLATLLGNTRFTLGSKLSLRVRTGFSYSEFPITQEDGTTQVEQDLRWRYAAQFWREGNWNVLGLGFFGRAVLTAPGYLGAKSRHYLGATALFDGDVVQPGVLVGVSLDDVVRDTAPIFVGITLSTQYLQ